MLPPQEIQRKQAEAHRRNYMAHRSSQLGDIVFMLPGAVVAFVTCFGDFPAIIGLPVVCLLVGLWVLNQRGCQKEIEASKRDLNRLHDQMLQNARYAVRESAQRGRDGGMDRGST